MNKQELIEKINNLSYILTWNIPRINREIVIDLIEQLDEPQPIKLKDVTTRIKQLDIGTRKVWLDEFLNELGSDYGTLKYKDGYEQGKFEASMIPYEEPQKVTIPRFIADWIVQAKEDGYNIAGAINEAPKGEVDDWLELENVDIFAEAWVNGCHIEKEKRYLVKMKGAVSSYLNYDSVNEWWFLNKKHNGFTVRTHHTRKELEEAGFEEVFNSPLFEVEEVEE